MSIAGVPTSNSWRTAATSNLKPFSSSRSGPFFTRLFSKSYGYGDKARGFSHTEAMQDRELYEKLLGLKEPWFVEK
ncbi:MAG: hypothetical protein ACOYVH_00795, partial [Spirochaetota bacterium]